MVSRFRPSGHGYQIHPFPILIGTDDGPVTPTVTLAGPAIRSQERVSSHTGTQKTEFNVRMRGRQSKTVTDLPTLPLRAQEMRITLRKIIAAETEDDVSVNTAEFFIGRSSECHFRPACPMVSRVHCELLIGDGRVAVRDLGSKNGTFVNGERVTGQWQLFPGYNLAFGRCLFEIVFHPGDSCIPETEKITDRGGCTSVSEGCQPRAATWMRLLMAGIPGWFRSAACASCF